MFAIAVPDSFLPIFQMFFPLKLVPSVVRPVSRDSGCAVGPPLRVFSAGFQRLLYCLSVLKPSILCLVGYLAPKVRTVILQNYLGILSLQK